MSDVSIPPEAAKPDTTPVAPASGVHTKPVPILTSTEGLSTLVHEAIGAASTCWESMDNTGIFDEAAARDIAAQVIAYVEANYAPKETLEDCPICSQAGVAAPVNYTQDPYEKTHWHCRNCGARFSGKVHA